MEHLDPELLSAYIDAELSPDDMAQVERHLASCAACRVEYEELRGISTLVRELPVYLPKRDVDLAAAPQSGSPVIARILEFSKPLAVAAVILLVAFAGLRLLTDVGEDSGDDGDQISFSAVQPTSPDGTESASRASDTTAAEAPAADGAQADQDPSDAETSFEEAPAGTGQQDVPAPAAAFQRESGAGTTEAAAIQQEPAPATVAPTATAEPPSGDDDSTSSRITAGIVIAIVVLVGGAAAWYMLFRSPRRIRD